MISTALPLRLASAALLLVLAACDDGDLQEVKPVLEVSPGSLDFGQRPVLDELVRDLLVENIGGAPLEFFGIAVEGDDAAFFTLEGEVLSQLDPGSQAGLKVQFRAREMRPYAATLVFLSSDAEKPRVEVALTGEGSTAARALIEPASLDFGRVGENRSVVRRVKITSIGTADLKIRTIAFKGGSSAAYGFVGSTRTPQVLVAHEEGTPDAFAEITVKFAPTTEVLDLPGTLVLETTDPDHALVEIPLIATLNRQPIAVPGADRFIAPGTRVTLDGSASSDPDGDDPITFKWTLSQRPQASATALTDALLATPSLTPDQPGAYVLDLVVTDAAGLASKTQRVTVNGVSAEKLVVELVWDHPTADLDLHFLPEGEALDSELDCVGFNPHPDFGLVANPNDDPSHSGDRLSGFGPETVTYEEPYDGKFVVSVKYVSPQGSSQLQLRATVRVYLYGVVQRELQRVMATPGELWNVALVEWPNGLVTTPFDGTP